MPHGPCRALKPEPGDRCVHQSGMFPQQGLMVQAEPFEPGEPHICDEHIGLRDQLLGDGQAVIIGEIQGDTALGPVVQFEHGVGGHVTTEHVLEGARRVATQRLNLDHIGTPVRQDSSRGGSRDPHAKFNDSYALEWSWQCSAPRSSTELSQGPQSGLSLN